MKKNSISIRRSVTSAIALLNKKKNETLHEALCQTPTNKTNELKYDAC
jgi:hypothetical protein